MSNLTGNVEQVLRMPRLETLAIEGAAQNVCNADEMAWQGLEGVLGTDPLAAWSLKLMAHEYVPAELGPDGRPCVRFRAEFVRKPDESE